MSSSRSAPTAWLVRRTTASAARRGRRPAGRGVHPRVGAAARRRRVPPRRASPATGPRGAGGSRWPRRSWCGPRSGARRSVDQTRGDRRTGSRSRRRRRSRWPSPSRSATTCPLPGSCSSPSSPVPCALPGPTDGSPRVGLTAFLVPAVLAGAVGLVSALLASRGRWRSRPGRRWSPWLSCSTRRCAGSGSWVPASSCSSPCSCCASTAQAIRNEPLGRIDEVDAHLRCGTSAPATSSPHRPWERSAVEWPVAVQVRHPDLDRALRAAPGDLFDFLRIHDCASSHSTTCCARRSRAPAATSCVRLPSVVFSSVASRVCSRGGCATAAGSGLLATGLLSRSPGSRSCTAARRVCTR